MSENPWDEEWGIEGGWIVGPSVRLYDESSGPRSACERAITLAAAAPDLYRALAAVEWEDGYCPLCFLVSEDGHRSNCSVGAALKKARGER